MTTIPQYARVMRNAQWDVCMRLGVDMSTATSTERAMAISGLVTQAILVKALVDKGIITDAELLAAINAVRNSPWQPGQEPEHPVPWDTTPVTGI